MINKKIKKVIYDKKIKKRKPDPNRIPKHKFLETDFFVPNKNFDWSLNEKNIYSKFKHVDVKKSLYEVVDNKESINRFNTKVNSKILNKNKTIECDLIKCKQIEIFPDDKQKEIILEWIEKARITYNITLNYVKKHGLKSNTVLREEIINKQFKPCFKEKMFIEEDNMKNKKWKIPCNVIRESIKDVIKSYASSIALLKAGFINNFNIKKKTKEKINQTILIGSCDFNPKKNSFYHSYLKEMNSGGFKLSDVRNIYKCDVRLVYNQRTKKFMLNIPMRKDFEKQKIQPKKYNVCGIDPGLKTFMTIYNPQGECEKIFNRDKTKRLTNLVKKKYSLLKLKDKKRKHYKALIKINYKIECFRKELHYKSAIHICSKYNEVYIGKLSTKSFIGKKNNMQPLDKLYGLALGHCQFRTILENKALEFNVNLNICKEHYTSKTCGVCGNTKDIGSNSEYECKICKCHLDRDLNGARNILIKHFGLTSRV